MNDLTPATIDKLRQTNACRGIEQVDATGLPFAVIPKDCEIKPLDEFIKPRFIDAGPCFKEINSFIAYVLRFATEHTTIFANPSPECVNFTAIIDYHHGNTPEWCKHVATFVSELTPEFQTWRAANRKQMDQVQFATWLEDNAALLVEPKGAELLELVRSLEGHKNARFSGAVRLATGNVSVAWEEETVVRGSQAISNGSIELPLIITAGIAPFYGTLAYAVQARLKTKVQDRKLFLWYETISEHLIMRDSIALVVQKVVAELKRPVLIGTP